MLVGCGFHVKKKLLFLSTSKLVLASLLRFVVTSSLCNLYRFCDLFKQKQTMLSSLELPGRLQAHWLILPTFDLLLRHELQEEPPQTKQC